MKFSLFFFALLSSAVVEGSVNCINGKSYTCADGKSCNIKIQDSKTTYSCADNSTCTTADCSGTTVTTTTSSASELLGVCAAVAVVAVSVVGAIY